MTDRDPTASQPTAVRSPRRRPSLYRTVLSIAVAALIAAWLPFSVLYVTAVHNHAQAVAASKPTTQGPASGSGHAAQPLASVKTRTS